jgi:formate dehydrogenase major subunit
VEHAELIFVIGSNPTANHPVAATWMKNAAQKRGAKIVLADPRAPTRPPRLAHAAVQGRHRRGHAQRADPHVIDEGLVDEAFIRERAPTTSRRSRPT